MMRAAMAADHAGFTSKGQVAEMTHSAMPAQATEHTNHGVITSVRGSVVDVRFEDRLPPIYSLLYAGQGGAGRHRGADAARCPSCPRDRA